MEVSGIIVTFANVIEKKGRVMCTINVQVDEAVVRDLMPELDSVAAISLWVQQLVDLRIRQMELEDEETIDLETMREDLHRMVKEVYAQP